MSRVIVVVIVIVIVIVAVVVIVDGSLVRSCSCIPISTPSCTCSCNIFSMVRICQSNLYGDADVQYSDMPHMMNVNGHVLE